MSHLSSVRSSCSAKSASCHDHCEWALFCHQRWTIPLSFALQKSLPQDFIYKISSISSLNKPKSAKSSQSFCSAIHFLSFPWNYDLHYHTAGTARTTINLCNHFFCISAEQIHWAPPSSFIWTVQYLDWRSLCFIHFWVLASSSVTLPAHGWIIKAFHETPIAWLECFFGLV